jgi:uncharacterized membrane protein
MKPRKFLFAGALAAFLAAAGFTAHELALPGCTAIQAAGDTVIIPVRDLARGAVKFFCYRDNGGEKLRFLLARGKDGNIKAVFDACEQCYRYHEGYTYADGYVICRLCGTRYKVHDIEHGSASCVPAALQSHSQDGTVQIKIGDLKRGRALF